MRILISATAKKQLRSSPEYISRKFEYWLDLLQTIGLREARRYKGFHDEPLHGDRKGQPSVRLSRSYRIIYREIEPNRFEVIEVLEVNKHDY
jgi:proteic killer suppression protein